MNGSASDLHRQNLRDYCAFLHAPASAEIANFTTYLVNGYLDFGTIIYPKVSGAVLCGRHVQASRSRIYGVDPLQEIR